MTTIAAPTELADVVQNAMQRWDVPGMAVGVLKDGETQVFPFGLASTETDTAVREEIGRAHV